MIDRELLKTVRHVALATVNEDGSPHNTPLFFMYSSDFKKMYWGSHPRSLHSRNIDRTSTGFVAVFDAKTVGQGGIYLSLKNAHSVGEDELPEALQVHNDTRARWDKQPLPIEYYQKEDGQRMYVADVAKIELYSVIRDENGLVIEETRKEITAQELLHD